MYNGAFAFNDSCMNVKKEEEKKSAMYNGVFVFNDSCGNVKIICV